MADANETAAHAEEILTVGIADLDLDDKRARIRAKSGAIEYVFRRTGKPGQARRTSSAIPVEDHGLAKDTTAARSRRPPSCRQRLADWTRDGSLAEYTAVEARNLVPLPADIGSAVG